jgi:hypothetical protein
VEQTGSRAVLPFANAFHVKKMRVAEPSACLSTI